MRREPELGETVAVSAADPLNLVGILVPGDRVAANSGGVVTFRDGAALLEHSVSSITELSAAL
jgi:ATP-dependent Lhr-like helicase